jgi:hypothetical protein
MPRWSRLLLVALLLPGCVLVRESSIDERPEQFQFTVTAGPGAGPAADAIVGEFAGGPGGKLVPGSASLVASVMTPLGRVDLVQFQVLSEGQVNDCAGEFRQSGSSVGCGPSGDGSDPLAGSAIAVHLEGTIETWSTSTIRVAPGVATIAAVAEDGTRYTIVPAGGYGYVAWPRARGALTYTALDADGTALGTTDGFGPAPEPAPIN